MIQNSKNIIKILAVLFLCSILIGCSKKTENTSEQKIGIDTTVTKQKVHTDTTKPTVSIKKKETLKNPEGKQDTSSAVDTLSYEEKQGKFIFVKYCAVCHGELGKSNGFNTYNLNPKPKSFTDSNYISTYSDERLIESIANGGRGVNKSALMPSWSGTLSKDEIIYVAKYVRYLNELKH